MKGFCETVLVVPERTDHHLEPEDGFAISLLPDNKTRFERLTSARINIVELIPDGF